jgi:hypothetical protein
MSRETAPVDLVLVVCPNGVLVSYDIPGDECIVGGMSIWRALDRVNQTVNRVRVRPMTIRTGATTCGQP